MDERLTQIHRTLMLQVLLWIVLEILENVKLSLDKVNQT